MYPFEHITDDTRQYFLFQVLPIPFEHAHSLLSVISSKFNSL